MFDYLIIFCLLIYLLCRFINKFKGLPPGPTPLPLIGNVFDIPLEGIDLVINKFGQEYGGVFTLWMPFPTIFFTDFEILKNTVIRNGEVFAGRPTFEIMKIIVDGNYGLLLEDNSFYKSQRQFLIHTMRKLGVGSNAIKGSIIEMCHRTIKRLEATNEEVIEIRDYLVDGVANVIHQLAFGWVRPEGDKEIIEFQRNIMEVFEHLTDPKMIMLDLFLFAKHFDKQLGLGLETTLHGNDAILEFLRRHVKEHQSRIQCDEEPSCFIDAFLHEIKRRKDEGNETIDFTEHQLVVAIYDLYSAGFETIVITLRFCFLYLLNYPQVQTKIREEIDANVGREKDVTIEDQKMLPYTCAFIQEVYRLGYVFSVNIMRTTFEDTEVNGYKIPAGTRVVPQYQTVHMDEKEFPNPSYLAPERHIQNGEFVKNDKINPFSIGKRACLGENLGRMEVFMFFCALMQRFRFQPEGVVPPQIKYLANALRYPQEYKIRAIRR